jgi:D-sedoheptulose 7-phosphate isomerase
MENTKRIDELIKRYPTLLGCNESILDSFIIMRDSFSSNGKMLICGNGGSCSDSEHIAGELMKGFEKRRECPKSFGDKLISVSPNFGLEIKQKLQGALPCISLSGEPALSTAFSNDVRDGGSYVFAQQVYGYGQQNDVLLSISTSGNSKNVLYASVVAKAKGMKIVGLLGHDGGKIKTYCDSAIVVPVFETYKIQELHLPIYHCLCLMLEDWFFGDKA